MAQWRPFQLCIFESGLELSASTENGKAGFFQDAANGYLEELADGMFRRHFGGLTDNATLADFANVTMGQSPAGSSYNEAGIGTIFYQGRAEFGWRYPTQRLSTTEPKRMAKAGDVLMSVRAPVGDLNLAYEDCCIGRGLAAIHCDYPSYGLYLMRSLHKKLYAYNGEGTVFGSINGKALNGLPIALPNNAAIRAFEKEATPIDTQIRNNEVESRALVTLRDTLLPKLMAGEIDVSKVDLTQLNSHLVADLSNWHWYRVVNRHIRQVETETWLCAPWLFCH